MQIVIDIPKSAYERLQTNLIQNGSIASKNILNAVKAGILLPKHHGRLIDADDLWDAYHDVGYDFYEAIDIVKPIIEATE